MTVTTAVIVLLSTIGGWIACLLSQRALDWFYLRRIDRRPADISDADEKERGEKLRDFMAQQDADLEVGLTGLQQQIEDPDMRASFKQMNVLAAGYALLVLHESALKKRERLMQIYWTSCILRSQMVADEWRHECYCPSCTARRADATSE